jgi:hypothetical protein
MNENKKKQNQQKNKKTHYLFSLLAFEVHDILSRELDMIPQE